MEAIVAALPTVAALMKILRKLPLDREDFTYELAWSGYKSSKNSWHDFDDLLNMEELLREFEERHPDLYNPEAYNFNQLVANQKLFEKHVKEGM